MVCMVHLIHPDMQTVHYAIYFILWQDFNIHIIVCIGFLIYKLMQNKVVHTWCLLIKAIYQATYWVADFIWNHVVDVLIYGDHWITSKYIQVSIYSYIYMKEKRLAVKIFVLENLGCRNLEWIRIIPIYFHIRHIPFVYICTKSMKIGIDLIFFEAMGSR